MYKNTIYAGTYTSTVYNPCAAFSPMLRLDSGSGNSWENGAIGGKDTGHICGLLNSPVKLTDSQQRAGLRRSCHFSCPH